MKIVYSTANPNAIYLLEKNQCKICWCNLSSNPNAMAQDFVGSNNINYVM